MFPLSLFSQEKQFKGNDLTIQDIIDQGKYNTQYFVVYLNEKYIGRLQHRKIKVSDGDRLKIYPLVDGG